MRREIVPVVTAFTSFHYAPVDVETDGLGPLLRPVAGHRHRRVDPRSKLVQRAVTNGVVFVCDSP